MKDSPNFSLRIEGQGEYLQGAKFAWIYSVKGFDENKKCKDCFKPKKEVITALKRSNHSISQKSQNRQRISI